MLFVFDVGNTLKKNGKIHERNKQSINEIQLSNDVCIATFRNKSLLVKDLESIYYDFLVTHNGGAIYHKDTLLSVEFLSSEMVDSLFKFATSNNLTIAFYKLDESYCLSQDDLAVVKEKKFPISNNVQKYSNKEIVSIALFSLDTIDVPFKNLTVDYWENRTKCNIQSIKANKVIAIEKIHQKINSSWDKTISFGDGPNDSKIIQKSFIGYAMNNSHPDSLSAANHIIDNNDGLAVHNVLCNYLSNSNSKSLK